VAITVDVAKPVDEVVLNALELDLDEAWIVGADGTRTDAGVTLDAERERATLALSGTVATGPATLHVRFRGVLNDKLNGFYRSTFTDAGGAEAVIATTQMEATFARKAFPCWDEPDFKATFAVTLDVPEAATALSNGAELERVASGVGRATVRFAETMPMSTYLVAFVVGPLEVTESVDVDGVALRVACPPGKAHLAPFALDVGAACLRYFTDYYGIAYPGGKLDLVAIPDFAFGAMENLGCVTFREVLLLIDPARASQPELQNVTDVVNHEIAHMWFGDLVTMRWWNGIWLNEAFATFMELKATDAFRPDWQRWTSFGLSRSAAFDTDALDSTRPIEFPVVSPEEAEGMFDVLTYEKGGAVLRMLEQYLGEDRFRDGIRRYLAAHAYANTETTDLWDAIEAETGEPVRRIMDSWIFQGGYPVVEVERTGDRTLRLRQERFRISAEIEGDTATPEGLGEVWSVPVVLTLGTPDGERTQRVLLEAAEQDVELDAVPDWVLVNAGGHGFYRVRYAAALGEALVGHGIGHLDPLERYGLIDDAFASVVAGAVTAAEFLGLARAYAEEADVSVWDRLGGALDELARVLDDPEVSDDARAAYQVTVRALIGPALRRLGLVPTDGEDDRTRELRGTLLRLAALVGGDETAVAHARTVHTAALAAGDSDEAGEPALVAAAAVVVATTGDEADYEAFLARSKAAPTPQDERRALFALARFRDEALFDRTLASVLTDIRSQDGPYVLRVALTNRVHGPRAWAFVTRHWDDLVERFPSNSVVRMLEGITSLTGEAVAADVRAFLAEHPVPQGAKQVAQHLERQQAGVALRRREATPLADSLG